MADRIKGITIELDGETTGLKKALSGVTKQSIDIQKELTDVQRLLKFDPGNTTLLAQKQELLSKQIEVTSQKLKGLKDAQSQVEQQFKSGKIGEGQYRAFQREIESTEGNLKKLKQSLSKIDDGNGISKAKKEMDSLGKSTAEAENKAGSLKGKLGDLAKGGVGLAAKGIVATGAAMTGAGIASVKLASDLGEVQNVVDTTFGDNASKINEWSKGAATSFGMSELSAKKMNGTLGAMLKSMGLSSDETLNMSESMVGLAGDFASFYNLDPEEAFEKIRSGISGETEPLKQLGINMSVANLNAFALSKGINKTYDSMTQAEQATLRYNYLMSVSKDAQGDFAKTSDSLANQLRIAQLNIQDLGGAIGTALLPMAQEAAKSLNEMLGQLKTAFNEGGFQGLATALGGALGQIIANVAAQLPNIVNMAVMVIQSFVSGIQSNLPMIMSSAVQIITGLTTGILTILPQLLTIGLQIIGGLVSGIGQALPALIPAAVQCVNGLVQGFIDNLPMILNAGLQLLEGLTNGIINALPQLIASLPQIIQSIVDFITQALPQILESGLSILLAIIDGLVQCLPQLIAMLPQIINTIINFITQNLPTIIDAGVKVLLALIDGLIKALPKLIEMLPQITSTIIKTLIEHLPEIIDAGIKINLALIKGLIESIPKIIAAMPEIIKSIKSPLEGVSLTDIGKNIIQGLIDGIKNMIGRIKEVAGEIADTIKNKIKNALDIHSPSRVMMELGAYTGEGFGLGIESTIGSISKQANAIAAAAIPNVNAGSFDMGVNATGGGMGTASGFNEMLSVMTSMKDEITSLKGALNNMKVLMDSREVGKLVTPAVSNQLAFNNGRKGWD